VLAWILNRCAGTVAAIDTPIGNMPRPGDLDIAGLDISAEALAELSAVPNAAWRKEMASIRTYLLEFGSHLPAVMLAQIDEISRRLAADQHSSQTK
jgi:phosphoenolpyruvate carboxykinase (GTP)